MNSMNAFIKTTYQAANLSYNGVGNRMNQQAQNAQKQIRDLQRSDERVKNDPTLLWNQQVSQNSIFNSAREYTDALRAQRTKASDTSLSMKKLKYQFKDISSKILRSKTSKSARQVVGQARREIIRLKRERQNGDSEELEAAIAHAKAMERVARKKVKHLEEEEMAKAAMGPCSGDAVEQDAKTSEVDVDKTSREEKVDPDMELASNDNWETELASANYFRAYDDFKDYIYGMDDISMDELLAMYDESSYLSENMDMLLADVGEMTSELMDEFEESMRDILEELGLDELSDSLLSAKGDMDPVELKEMKIKHRNKELKEIIKADADYLKIVFDNMEKIKNAAVGLNVDTSVGGSFIGSSANSPAPVIDLAL